jgi:hypothetical protein
VAPLAEEDETTADTQEEQEPRTLLPLRWRDLESACCFILSYCDRFLAHFRASLVISVYPSLVCYLHSVIFL